MASSARQLRGRPSSVPHCGTTLGTTGWALMERRCDPVGVFLGCQDSRGAKTPSQVTLQSPPLLPSPTLQRPLGRQVSRQPLMLTRPRPSPRCLLSSPLYHERALSKLLEGRSTSIDGCVLLVGQNVARLGYGGMSAFLRDFRLRALEFEVWYAETGR
jgi:hypothetical protein